ncbi:uncharacterized protein LOC143559377 [Bidens hawaiensis]|uniref:uncharacterized protein LOC143559377 n=1 Tax=Bidens hawaiensis TaxID=980011 RepID=UPI00404ACF8F
MVSNEKAAFNKTIVYQNLMEQLLHTNTSNGTITELKNYEESILKLDLEDKYAEPMTTIGVYIAVASLCCVLAMVVDLLRGLSRKKRLFPCKYFSVNAFSLAVIAVAMKLPVDLSGNMPGDVDQAAKLGSLAFMCTMMANLLPCLATMGSAELLTNVTALGVLVITLVVNVCIQIDTGVVGKVPTDLDSISTLLASNDISPEQLKVILDCFVYTTVAIIYVAMLLLLLIIYVCSSLAILRSKEIIESKYEQAHKATSISTNELLTVEKLQQHVSNHWIIAGSSSPQFIQACAATTAASGVICFLSVIFHLLIMIWAIPEIKPENYNSDYKWSTLVILIVQFVGVIFGTIAPVSRCFASLSFKLTFKSISNHFKVFKVEKYWTQKLYDSKEGRISLPFQSHTLKVVIKNLRNLALSICIILQVVVVVVCKIIALIFFVLTQILRCLAWPIGLIHALFCSSGKSTENLEQRKFVLQLENENELADRILNGLSKSFDQLIKKSKNNQPKNLMKLITERSTKGFQGVRKYDNTDHPDCWSLAVVTLTTIATTLPDIEKVEVKSLLKSVKEGLEYITLVEENLNATDEYKSIQKAAKTLWEEVDFHHKWLGIRLKKDIASRGSTTSQIVQLFLEKAESKKNIKEGDERTNISICANSMYRIAQTIINDKESHDKLFDELSSRIADIMAACLSNLPQVIAMKAHTRVIEKREASVKAAAQLLGETKEIIKTLQDPSRHVPHMGPDDLSFIDKWRAHFRDPESYPFLMR